jgi:hypothetical protein
MDRNKMNNKKLPEIDEIGSAFFDLEEAIRSLFIILSGLQRDVDKIKSVMKID